MCEQGVYKGTTVQSSGLGRREGMTSIASSIWDIRPSKIQLGMCVGFSKQRSNRWVQERQAPLCYPPKQHQHHTTFNPQNRLAASELLHGVMKLQGCAAPLQPDSFVEGRGLPNTPTDPHGVMEMEASQELDHAELTHPGRCLP